MLVTAVCVSFLIKFQYETKQRASPPGKFPANDGPFVEEPAEEEHIKQIRSINPCKPSRMHFRRGGPLTGLPYWQSAKA